MKARRILAAVLTAIWLTALNPALARSEDDNGVSAAEAAELVRERVGGQVLAVERVRGEDGSYYAVRVLVAKGKVKVYRVDARSGRMF